MNVNKQEVLNNICHAKICCDVKIMNKKYLIIIFLSGLVLNLSIFIDNIWTDFLAFVVIAPVFYSLQKIEKRKRYLAGLLFFGAWLIPTSYWYFNFMPWWLAILSLTFFTLMANVFQVSNIVKNRNIILDFAMIIFFWLLITFLRMNLPILEDWWIPHLAYTQWQNLSVLQIISVGEIYGIIFAILFSNGVIAYFWLKDKKVFSITFTIIIFAIMISGNFYFTKLSQKGQERFNFIGIQISPENGFYADANLNDIKKLQEMTKAALAEIENKNKKTFVLWPENMIEEQSTKNLQDFARNNNIYLVFNQAEKRDDELYNTVVVVDSYGREILKNYKSHAAPGENIKIVKSINNSIEIDEQRITTDICYDLHYSDISKRLNGNDLLFVPVDDDRFGSFMPHLHAQDIIFRAIKNRISIFSASTNGPTMFIDKYGLIKSGPLKFYDKSFLIFE
jgi:apolipoprotein N-acyltransferase